MFCLFSACNSNPTSPINLSKPTLIEPSTPRLVSALGINKAVDLRAFDGPVMNQFEGACSAFATAAAMNNLLKQKGITKQVSERHLWSLYGVYDMDYAISAAKKYFVTEEQYWPLKGDRTDNFQDYASVKILQTKQHQYNMEAALQGLSSGHPLVMAIQVPADLTECKVHINPKSKPTPGQHVVEAVGYQLDDSIDGGGYFIIKNSWGTACGDKGYQYYPFALCKRNDLYCYFTEVADVEAKI